MSASTEEDDDGELVVTDTKGRSWPAAMRGSTKFPDYASLAGEAPFDKPAENYSEIERRAELYRMIEQEGHPKNLEQSQSTLGSKYGVSQQMISKDFRIIREYVASHDAKREKSKMGWLAEQTVSKHIEAAERAESAGRLDEAADRMEDAFDTQRDFMEYLIETGAVDAAPDQLEIEGDAGDAYMAMLRQVSESE
jgi:hypothetical protein